MKIIDKSRVCKFNIKKYYPLDDEKILWGYGMESWNECMQRGWFWHAEVLWADTTSLDLTGTGEYNLDILINKEPLEINAPYLKNILINKGIFEINIDLDTYLLEPNLEEIHEMWYNPKMDKWFFEYIDTFDLYESDDIENLMKIAIKEGEMRSAKI